MSVCVYSVFVLFCVGNSLVTGWSPSKESYRLCIHSLIHSSINDSTAIVGPLPLLQFRNRFYTDSMTPWTSDQPVARPLPTHRTTQTRNKRIHRHQCLWVGFESMIPAFERAKTVHTLYRAVNVIGTDCG
jgi:hypothetical protein